MPSAPSSPAATRAAPILAAVVIVFLSSLFIMTLELTASRLVAQYLGVSLYTWTAVIGVVLAGITLGNYVGGHLADLYVARRLLPALFLLASVLCLAVLFLVDWMGTWERPETLSWPLWVLRNITLIFLLPSALLGTIAPVAAKMALSGHARVGSTVGTLYAAGAAGSIVGTFLTGYVLVDMLGSKTIISAVAVALALMGLALAVGQRRAPTPFLVAWLAVASAVSALAIGPWEPARYWGHFLGLRFDTSHLILQDESSYFAIEIYEAEELDDTRVLALDHLVHSYVAMDDPLRLEYAYETVYAAVTRRLVPADQPLRALFIGGGGYTLPRYLEALYPAARIDVAEIDSAVTEAARAALGLPPPGRTRILSHAEDARMFVRRRVAAAAGDGSASRYDFVYGDAFNDLGVPFHLTTDEFNRDVLRLLGPDGVYLVNIIDIYREGMGRFLGAFVGTVRRTFPYVYVFSAEPEGVSGERDTFTVVSASRRLPVRELSDLDADPRAEGALIAWSEDGVLGGDMHTLLERGRGVILTDDYAPVDNLLAPVFAAQ